MQQSIAVHGTMRDDDLSFTRGPRQQIERERRVRREIANSNERRRMQSINQGYMSLKGMLPIPDGGEKLSKVGGVPCQLLYQAQSSCIANVVQL